MRKYWKLIAVLTAIVLCIGVHYIQVAAEKNLTLSIETISGDEQHVDNILMHGDIQIGQLYQPVTISNQGETTIVEDVLIQELIHSRVPKQMEPYISQYRSFMRGKDYYIDNYAEDDKRIIYVKEPQNNFNSLDNTELVLNIEILNKETTEVEAFQVKVADISYYWMAVQDVQVTDDTIAVLATVNQQNGATEEKILTISLANKALQHATTILATKGGQENQDSLFILKERASFAAEGYYVFGIETVEQTYSDAPYADREERVSSVKLYLYNCATMKKEEVTIPTEVMPYVREGFVSEHTLYIPIKQLHGMTMYQYHFETNTWGDTLKIDYAHELTDIFESHVFISNEKVYSVHKIEMGYVLYVHDLQQGKELYVGKIKQEGSGNLPNIWVEDIVHN